MLINAEDNPYFKLLSLGQHTWHRWVRTAISESKAKELNISAILPLNSDDQRDIAKSIGVTSLPDANKAINLAGLKFSKNFSVEPGTVFPSTLHFGDSSFRRGADFRSVIFLEACNFQGSVFHESAKFNNAIFHCSADFQKARFRNTVNFNGARFMTNAHFEKVRFRSAALFRDAVFKLGALYDGSKFENSVLFHNAEFEFHASFRNTLFRKLSSFVNTKFGGRTDFRGGSFDYPPVFAGAAMHQDTTFHERQFLTETPLIASETYEDRARSWRNLKTAMNKIANHSMELKFFGMELDEKRKYEKIWTKLLLDVYSYTSNYGASALKPMLIMLIGNSLIFPILYFTSFNNMFSVEQAYILSMTSAFPYLASAASDQVWSKVELVDSLYLQFQFLSGIQGISTALFLFLIALAVKNQLSIK